MNTFGTAEAIQGRSLLSETTALIVGAAGQRGPRSYSMLTAAFLGSQKTTTVSIVS